MAITLTVGTNTYVSLADAESYHTAYGQTDWTDTTDDEAKKQALVLATQSVDLLYGEKYMSYIATETQALLFPRAQFYDQNGRTVTGIPTCLEDAVSELALMSLNGEDIFPAPNQQKNIRDESLGVGGVSMSASYFKPAESESYEGFNKIDIILRPILKKVSAHWSIKA